jgi:hypothetical protein
MIDIRYGISKKVRGKRGRTRILTENYGMTLDMTLEEMFADGHLVRKAITDKHPGWAVMGYCPKEEKHEEV